MTINAVAKAALTLLVPLALSATAHAASVRYELKDVATAVGQYPTGLYGSGSLLGYFVFDAGVGVTEYIITAVADNAVQFEWSSFPGFPHPSSVSSSFDSSTGVWDLFFGTGLGNRHGVTLDLAFRSADFDFTTGTIPLITSTNGAFGTSNWYEIVNSEYAAYGYVTSGSLAVVPEPASLALVALGLVAATSLNRRRAIRPPTLGR